MRLQREWGILTYLIFPECSKKLQEKLRSHTKIDFLSGLYKKVIRSLWKSQKMKKMRQVRELDYAWFQLKYTCN